MSLSLLANKARRLMDDANPTRSGLCHPLARVWGGIDSGRWELWERVDNLCALWKIRKKEPSFEVNASSRGELDCTISCCSSDGQVEKFDTDTKLS